MRKGDLTTPTLMWLVSVLIAIILVLWYVRTGFHDTGLDRVDEDLKNIHYDLSLACTNKGFQSDVHLYTKKGTIVVTDTTLCITKPLTQGVIERCLPTPCPLAIDATIDIATSTSLRITQQNNVFTVAGQ
ncbi:MAG: hypothetical protein OXR66_06800 [Candidatus Woesearchaeota archaeon]|nr:hypothetical protein [Candidatus Woesearchaeota archaeon]